MFFYNQNDYLSDLIIQNQVITYTKQQIEDKLAKMTQTNNDS